MLEWVASPRAALPASLSDADSDPRGQTVRTVPVSDTIPNNLRKILAFAAVVEIGTGSRPDDRSHDRRHTAAWRGGLRCGDAALPILRHCAARAGVGVLAGTAARRERLAGLRGDAEYSALITLYLTYLGTVGHLGVLNLRFRNFILRSLSSRHSSIKHSMYALMKASQAMREGGFSCLQNMCRGISPLVEKMNLAQSSHDITRRSIPCAS